MKKNNDELYKLGKAAHEIINSLLEEGKVRDIGNPGSDYGWLVACDENGNVKGSIIELLHEELVKRGLME